MLSGGAKWDCWPERVKRETYKTWVKRETYKSCLTGN